MTKDETYMDHASITQEGKLIQGDKKPEDWAFHYYTVQDDGQWAKLTYRFEAKINPALSFVEAQRVILNLRASSQKTDEKILRFLERMAKDEKRFTMDSLFAIKGDC